MNTKYIIGAIASVLVIAGAVFYLSSSSPITQTATAPSAQTQTVTPAVNAPAPALSPATTSVKKATTVAPRSSNATITSAVLTSAITKTATSVLAGNATTTFAPTAKNIYAVLSLRNATTRTQLSYIRKFNGKYIDSKVSHPLKTGDTKFYFGWPLKTGQTRNAGTYSLTFFVDGKKAQTVSYAVR